MTENRENWLYPDASGLYFPHDGFVMRATDGRQYDIDEECELLNELHKKNKDNEIMIEFLSTENTQIMNELKTRTQIQHQLEEENEQLKHDATVLICSNQEYRKKNEQLKQTIKEVLELLKEEVDLFSDKAIEHDIQAYIELGELDNKDAYYMAISTKKAIKLLREMIE